MEYAAGDILTAWLKQAQRSWREVLEVFVRDIQAPPRVREAIEAKLEREQQVASEEFQTAIIEERQRVEPREILIPDGDTDLATRLEALLPNTARTSVAVERYDPSRVAQSPEGFDSSRSDAATRAAAALIDYVAENQPFALTHATRLGTYRLSDTMILDSATRAHLELFRNAEDGGRDRTLIDRLEHCGFERLNSRQFGADIMGRLRDQGFVIAGSNSGYRLAVNYRDVQAYLTFDSGIIGPMASRLARARETIKMATGNELDILSQPEFEKLRKLM